MSTAANKRKAESAPGQFDDSDHDSTASAPGDNAPDEKPNDPPPDESSKKTDAKEECDPMSALADAASRVKEEPVAENRPQKKAKAATSDAVSSKDAISNALARLSNPPASKLSDYEKCSIFPQKLMQLLKNEEAPDAIWWLEDGESFAIEQEQFTKIMNKVSRTSKKKVKLDSILRNLYRWGFKKLKDRDLPPHVLAYSHPKFKRDACVELQTFSKKSEASPSGGSSFAGPSGALPAPTALARALSARAQAGYGDNWNEEGAGAGDKAAMMQQQNQYAMMMGGQMPPGAGGDRQMMLESMMMQRQQHQQMMIQNELLFQQQHHHRQALMLEAAAAERAAAMERYAAAQHMTGGSPPTGGYPFPPNYPPY